MGNAPALRCGGAAGFLFHGFGAPLSLRSGKASAYSEQASGEPPCAVRGVTVTLTCNLGLVTITLISKLTHVCS